MQPYYSDSNCEIFHGDCRHILSTLPAESVQTCVTSPPYWGLRDYGIANHRPLGSRKGDVYRSFIAALEMIGYKVEDRIINAADFGDATTRERLFIMARRDRKKIIWPVPSHGRIGSDDLFGNYRQPWRAAREIIDWTIPGKSIFDRKKPLADNTIKRIAAGLKKFGGPAAEPFLVMLNGGGRLGAGGVQSLDRPLPVITAGGNHFGVAQMEIEPFICANRTNNVPRSTDEPLPTIVTSGNIWLAEAAIEPFVIGQQSGAVPRSVDEPLPTIATGGAISLVEPVLVNMKGRSDASSIDQPAPTITAHARHLAVAESFIVPVTHQGGEDRCRAIELPLPTITGARRGELAVVEPFMTPYYSEGSGKTGKSIDEPLDTVTTKARHALVEPVIELAPPETSGRIIEIDGQHYLLDIRFRMLRNHELARAMGFNDEETTYEFVGTGEQVTKQIGNAVPVNTAAALVAALMEH